MPAEPIYYSGETLRRLPRLRAGERILCPTCLREHQVVTYGETLGPDGKLLEPPLVYACGGQTHLAGLGGHNVVGVPPDASGPEAPSAWKREDADA